MFTAADHEFMARALRLAGQGLYSTTPNPRVGCVLVKDGRIVGEGWHRQAGTAHAEVHDPVLIDCSGLTRIDFISAGALVNVLTVIQRSGKKIALRHPNHLVAELFGIVGMKSVASIVFAKH